MLYVCDTFKHLYCVCVESYHSHHVHSFCVNRDKAFFQFHSSDVTSTGEYHAKGKHPTLRT